MFLSHSDVLSELFGITAAQFIEAILKIWHNLSFGLKEVVESLKQLQSDMMITFLLLSAEAGLSPTSLPQMIFQRMWSLSETSF
ncbi:MAG TPA: hypothetical protein VG938_01765 [Verrucomicrobiae bacterium]|jgi:hypothetical protein|nr:hypothetical protein [Verrucomicrobiae bacterium]